MIKIRVDPAYAFDYLSIQQIKNNKVGINLVEIDIQNCIGLKYYDKIIKSKEYKDLVQANQDVFEAVDLAKKNMISAAEVDRLNYERYICKTKLNKKFFKSKMELEKKIGY